MILATQLFYVLSSSLPDRLSAYRSNKGPLILKYSGDIKNRELAVVNQGPRQSDDQMSGKIVSGMRRLKTTLVALSDRQSTDTIVVIPKD